MIALIFCILSFTAMEGIAWITHKYIMHGILWELHEDHHKPHPKILQKNDLFFLIFAMPGIALIYFGVTRSLTIMLASGIGITIYGICYFLIHDLFIHRRLKIFRNTNNQYLLALRKAHKAHHKHLEKDKGECFGMLWVPLKYYRK